MGHSTGAFNVALASQQNYQFGDEERYLVYLLVEKQLDPKYTWSTIVPVVLALDTDGAVDSFHVVNFNADDVARATSLPVHLLKNPVVEVEPVLDVTGADGSTGGALKPMALGGDGRMAAAAYADKYWSSYNSGYRTFSGEGGDCTNFVSQCMRAGGWADTGSLLDYRTPKAWFYWKTNQTYSWVNAHVFYDFTVSHQRSRLASHATDLWHGNLVQVAYEGRWFHSTIVTGRKDGLPLLTYHSTNTHNIPFYEFKSRIWSADSVNAWALHLT